MEYSKAEKTRKCRDILYSTRRIVDEKSAQFLLEHVFSNHPEWEEKVGIGVDHLEVRPDIYGGKCFFIVRRDGSFTDISFVASINPPKKRTDVMKACRTAIQPVIQEMRESITFPFVCPITGETVWKYHDVHIDHYDLTFNEVFEEWIKDKDINELYKKTLKSNRDNDMETYFDDEKVAKDFLEFHNNHTHLRAVSKKANLSTLRKNTD